MRGACVKLKVLGACVLAARVLMHAASQLIFLPAIMASRAGADVFSNAAFSECVNPALAAFAHPVCASTDSP